MIWVIKGWSDLPAQCLLLEESTSSQNYQPRRGCFVSISFLIIPDNYKYVKCVTVWCPLTTARWRAVRLKWHGGVSHPLWLSISSQRSRLMELLIGENTGFLDGQLPCDPILIFCCRKTSYSAAFASHCRKVLMYPNTFCLGVFIVKQACKYTVKNKIVKIKKRIIGNVANLIHWP